ncbi:MAG TPA: type II secretion system F family protein [Candidatus Brocadiia bacterium]|nr:type II secretion system F family protein [Candidatus Brocadiia bacterium]
MEGEALIEMAVPAAAAISVACAVWFLIGLYRDSRAFITPAARDNLQPPPGALLGLLLPFARFFGAALAGFAAGFGTRRAGEYSYLEAARSRVRRGLHGAGLEESMNADDFFGLILFGVFGYALMGFVFALVFAKPFPIVAGAAIGVIHPIVWLRDRIARRQTEMRRLMPYALDLLTLSVGAGLDFTAALERIVPKLAGSALAVEFGAMMREIQLGKPRREALRSMADRVQMTEMGTFATAMIQAEEIGAALGPVLRIHADQMRNDRSNRAEQKAVEAPVKILFPLIAFIFPTTFLILFGPMLATWLTTMVSGGR